MNMNKIYLVVTNDKKYAEWSKKMGKILKKNPLLYDHFQSQATEMRYAYYLAKASFVCYWEIQTDDRLARLAPAITQATLIQVSHRFLEQEKFEEFEVTTKMMSNFLRLLGGVDYVSQDEEGWRGVDDVSQDEEE